MGHGFRKKCCIAKLGGECVRCGFKDTRALQFDHLNGDGYLETDLGRSANKEPSGWPRTQAVFEAYDMGTLAEKYQLLCANCNQIKRREDGEHKHRSSRKQMELFK